jgi:RNA polymerase subunit RPABC4/transcription elongation factor Spt4
MTIPSLDTIISYATAFVAILGALLAAVWLSLVIWAFRDMRLRSRDPIAQLFAALVVAILPIAGIVIYLILRPPETLAQAYERALEEEALLQEIEEKPRCPGCSRAIEPDWIACPYCHTHLRQRCHNCAGLLELNWNLCPFCAAEQAPADIPIVETAHVREPALRLPEYQEDDLTDAQA